MAASSWGPLLDDLILGRATVARCAELREPGNRVGLDDMTPKYALVNPAGELAVPAGEANSPRSLWLGPRPEDPDAELFLGCADGTAYWAATLSADTAGALAQGGDLGWKSLRSLGRRLDDRDAGLATVAVALANWHAGHTHCPRCGTATVIDQLGWRRSCPADGSEHFPRTDPAVIVLVQDSASNALLGRAARWPGAAFSTLAGFVEPGETAEAAVAREVEEESGIAIDSLTYLGSQPWPFPASLMLGYHAGVTAVRPQPRVDGQEVIEATWVSRDELAVRC